MSFDLRTNSWIPFRRLSGALEWGRPDLIADALDADPVVAIASPRPDFDGALAEFLIGLLAVAYKPQDDDAWSELWENPPSSADLHQALVALPPAFDLDGDGPRFLQDFSADDLAGAEIAPVQELLVEGKNDPLFMKPETLRELGRPAAAMALITIQAYSPAGGRGYRTSMRGGGPLTTLVDPRPPLTASALPAERSLWRYLWANVPTAEQLRADSVAANRKSPESVFPWLAATRTSEHDRATTIADVSPYQAFFGMPRRIRLEFSHQPGVCDLTGKPDQSMVTGFRVRGYGVWYQGWRHPFTPYYAGKALNEWLPIHGQPGGIGWRDWLPLVQESASESKMPAAVVANFAKHRSALLDLRQYSVHAFGFDATNAKVRAWVDARLPAFAESDSGRLAEMFSLVSSLTTATDIAAFKLQRVVVQALYGGFEGPPGDLSFVKNRLWDATEGQFYESVFRAFASDDVLEASKKITKHFQELLLRESSAIYDDLVAADPSHPEQLRRAIVGRFDLIVSLQGGGKDGEKLFKALGLATPKARRSRAAKTSTETEVSA